MKSDTFRDKAVVVGVVANDESEMGFNAMGFAEGFPVGEVVFTGMGVVSGVDEVNVLC